MVPKAYEYSLKPSQDRMFLNEKDQPTNRLCLMHYPPTVATFRSWRGSVACIAQNLLAGKKNSEREGFEPSIPLLVYTPSKGAPSTTRTPLHGRSIALHEKIRGIGERGIRTLGTGKPVHWISSPAPSTTRTSLQAMNLYMRLRRFELPTLSSANWYSIQLSYSLIYQKTNRRGRDSNPGTRYQVNSLAGSPIRPLSHLSRNYLQLMRDRREWDSNPRRLAPQQFSRLPPSTTRTPLQENRFDNRNRYLTGPSPVV